MAKTLILIRHGHRDNSQRELDNGLTEKGRLQARAVRTFFNQRFSREEASGLWLISSPKKRCVETLQPLAKSLDRPVDIHPNLDEQGAKETSSRFQERVQSFLLEWNRTHVSVTVLCSHGDWLPVAVYHLLGLSCDLKKGSWTEVEWQSDRGLLKWAIPSFKHFYR